jgi:hypothetical protein
VSFPGERPCGLPFTAEPLSLGRPQIFLCPSGSLGEAVVPGLRPCPFMRSSQEVAFANNADESGRIIHDRHVANAIRQQEARGLLNGGVLR